MGAGCYKNIKRRTSHIIGSSAYLLESGVRRQQSLYAQYGLLKAKISKIFKSLFISGQIKKRVVGDDTGAPKKPQWGSPSPGNSCTAVHDDDYDDVGSARSERFVAYNRKCTAICTFEVVLIIAACTCLKI